MLHSRLKAVYKAVIVFLGDRLNLTDQRKCFLLIKFDLLSMSALASPNVPVCWAGFSALLNGLTTADFVAYGTQF